MGESEGGIGIAGEPARYNGSICILNCFPIFCSASHAGLDFNSLSALGKTLSQQLCA